MDKWQTFFTHPMRPFFVGAAMLAILGALVFFISPGAVILHRQIFLELMLPAAYGGFLTAAMLEWTGYKGRLKPVLNANTFTLENIAGSWNKDGTRQHDVYTDTYILKMSPQQHHGFYDIIWREKGMKNGERKVYRWDAEKQEYGSLE